MQLQPVDGHGLVNVEMILVTDAAQQVLTTTILGVPVTVTATPVSYAWDLGDGSAPITTTDPGARTRTRRSRVSTPITATTP